MATLGLLSPEFPSDSLNSNLEAIAATGAKAVQFDLASAVGDTFPTEAVRSNPPSNQQRVL